MNSLAQPWLATGTMTGAGNDREHLQPPDAAGGTRDAAAAALEDRWALSYKVKQPPTAFVIPQLLEACINRITQCYSLTPGSFPLV